MVCSMRIIINLHSSSTGRSSSAPLNRMRCHRSCEPTDALTSEHSETKIQNQLGGLKKFYRRNKSQAPDFHEIIASKCFLLESCAGCMFLTAPALHEFQKYCPLPQTSNPHPHSMCCFHPKPVPTTVCLKFTKNSCNAFHNQWHVFSGLFQTPGKLLKTLQSKNMKRFSQQ